MRNLCFVSSGQRDHQPAIRSGGGGWLAGTIPGRRVEDAIRAADERRMELSDNAETKGERNDELWYEFALCSIIAFIPSISSGC